MIIPLLIWAASIYGCRKLAEQKGRNVTNWTVAGVFFGLIALVVVAVMPSQNGGSSSMAAPNLPRPNFSDGQPPSAPPTDAPGQGGFNPPKFG